MFLYKLNCSLFRNDRWLHKNLNLNDEQIYMYHKKMSKVINTIPWHLSLHVVIIFGTISMKCSICLNILAKCLTSAFQENTIIHSSTGGWYIGIWKSFDIRITPFYSCYPCYISLTFNATAIQHQLSQMSLYVIPSTDQIEITTFQELLWPAYQHLVSYDN